MSLAVGDVAPQFPGLSDNRGKWILLYFYPKDDTPGCTTEACTLRDNFSKFAESNAAVFGVSADSEASHGKFTAKYTLPFPLIPDADKKVITAYQASNGLGTKRISYLINPQGYIAKIYAKVKPADHAIEVLQDIAAYGY